MNKLVSKNTREVLVTRAENWEVLETDKHRSQSILYQGQRNIALSSAGFMSNLMVFLPQR